MLLTVSVVGRAAISSHRSVGGFDYTAAATHLRLDGLVCGFALAALRSISPHWFGRLRRVAVWLIVVNLSLAAACLVLSQRADYVAGPLFLSAGLAALLAWSVDRPPLLPLLRGPIFWIAVGGAFYAVVELTSMRLRDRLVPAKTAPALEAEPLASSPIP